MLKGDTVWVVPPGFADGATWPLKVDEAVVMVAHPARCQLTNHGDRPIIESLTGVASRSTAFSCWRIFMMDTTHSPEMCCFYNVCLCCQCCGLNPAQQARTVRPGESTVKKLVPAGTTPAAPSNEAMERVKYWGGTTCCICLVTGGYALPLICCCGPCDERFEPRAATTGTSGGPT